MSRIITILFIVFLNFTFTLQVYAKAVEPLIQGAIATSEEQYTQDKIIQDQLKGNKRSYGQQYDNVFAKIGFGIKQFVANIPLIGDLFVKNGLINPCDFPDDDRCVSSDS